MSYVGRSFSSIARVPVTWPGCASSGLGPTLGVQAVGPGWGPKVFLAGTCGGSFVASHASMEALIVSQPGDLKEAPDTPVGTKIRSGENHCFYIYLDADIGFPS